MVAVAGIGDGDPEMAERIARHREDRPAEWTTLEIAGIPASTWLPEVPENACLVVDCLGTVLSGLLFRDAMPVDAAANQLASETVDVLADRIGDTIIVTNEVGSGIVPMSASGRLFRDVVGRANTRLIARADAAYLVVCGRCIDLKTMPADAAWPTD